MANEFASCADCREYTSPMDCKKYNNVISKLFGLLFRSDRAACIRQIKELGIDGHAECMAEKCSHTIKR